MIFGFLYGCFIDLQQVFQNTKLNVLVLVEWSIMFDPELIVAKISTDLDMMLKSFPH